MFYKIIKFLENKKVKLQMNLHYLNINCEDILNDKTRGGKANPSLTCLGLAQFISLGLC